MGAVMKTAMNTPMYPDVVVRLSGSDGNAFAIIAKCRKIAKEASLSKSELDKFLDEAMSGDYDDLLRTCMKWFTIE